MICGNRNFARRTEREVLIGQLALPISHVLIARSIRFEIAMMEVHKISY